VAKGVYTEINEKGLRDFLNAIKKDVSERSALIDQEIAAYGELMATNAKTIVPVDTGRLKNSISLKKQGFLSYELVAQTDYAAYIEFGTGDWAATYVPSLSPEWQEIAKQFQRGPGGAIPPFGYFMRSVKAYTPGLVKSIQKIVDKYERF
jgi:hypothetical protein